jgi:hypothetical protein
MLAALAGELRHLAAWLSLPAISVTAGTAAADELIAALRDMGAPS